MSNDEKGGVVPTTPPILEMRQITKKFGSLIANNDINLSLKPGEILGLLGENGAGKSTLMKVLYGLYAPDSGEILINSEPVAISSPQEAVDHGIGMVHQEFMLVPPLTVTENIVMGAEPGSAFFLDLKKAAKNVAEISSRYGLKVDPHKKIAELSVGLRQRVEILKALYRNAHILILDEPTAVLTPQEVRELFQVLRDFVSHGFSIILITHKLGEVMNVCDRVTVLRDGRLVDTVEVINTSKEQLARMMVGRDVVLSANRSKNNPGKPILEVANLHLGSSNEHSELRGINLMVRSGEVLGIAGVDGNGQKELSEVLSGMISPDQGEIKIDGENVTHLKPRSRHQRGMAFIPEDRKHTGLVMDFTLAENLALRSFASPPIAKGGWFRPQVMNRLAGQYLEEFDIRPRRIEAQAKNLSGGNQQKVILARELAGKPHLILAAQPTRGLDVGAIEMVHRMLITERQRGAAVLLISFELDEIRALSDRIVVLYEGQLVGEVSNEEATDELLGLWMAGVVDENQKQLGSSIQLFNSLQRE